MRERKRPTKRRTRDLDFFYRRLWRPFVMQGISLSVLQDFATKKIVNSGKRDPCFCLKQIFMSLKTWRNTIREIKCCVRNKDTRSHWKENTFVDITKKVYFRDTLALRMTSAGGRARVVPGLLEGNIKKNKCPSTSFHDRFHSLPKTLRLSLTGKNAGKKAKSRNESLAWFVGWRNTTYVSTKARRYRYRELHCFMHDKKKGEEGKFEWYRQSERRWREQRNNGRSAITTSQERKTGASRYLPFCLPFLLHLIRWTITVSTERKTDTNPSIL